MRAFRNQIRSGLGAKPLEDGGGSSAEPVEDDVCSAASDDSADELPAQKILRSARNKYIERGITGTISLTRQRGIVTHCLSCEVTEEDIPEDEDTDLGDLGRMDKKMISLFDGLLNRLEKAAKAWEGHPYAHKVSIGRSSELGFYLPVFISAGFRIEIALEANALSLVKSRERSKRRKAFKAALKTIDHSIVEGVQQQGGFPLVFAQQAVIATQNSSVEDALLWAVSKSPAEIEIFQKELSGES